MTRLTDSPPVWRRPSVLEILAVNLIPLIGLIWLDWDGFTVLLVYWLENVVVGVFTLLRMVLARPVYGTLAEEIAVHHWWLKRHPISEDEWQLARRTPGRSYCSHNELFIPLFLGHYSLFLPVTIALESVEEPPEESNARLVVEGNRLRIELPPRGLGWAWSRTQPLGCLVTGTFFLAVLSMMMFGAIEMARYDIGRGESLGQMEILLLPLFPLVLGTAWLLVFSLVTMSVVTLITCDRRQGLIVLDEQSLCIQERTLWPGREATFRCAHIADVAPVNTGSGLAGSGGYFLFQLRVLLKSGEAEAFLTGRDSNELAWVATMIQTRLTQPEQ